MSSQASQSEVRGVLLPIQSGQLLLPNATVAEVTGYQEPTAPKVGAPDWLLGGFTWRQQLVPLVSFDALTGVTPEPAGNRARIAVCNTLNGDSSRPYIALLLRSIPHLVRISEENIAPIGEAESESSMLIQQVKVNGQVAVIPNLDLLEEALKDIDI